MVDHGIARPALTGADPATACWPADAPPGLPAGFRTDLELERVATVELAALVPAGFVLWVDGRVVARGPLRWAPEHPEVSTTTLELRPGRHPVALQVDAGRIAGRITAGLPSFAWIRVLVGGVEIAPDWSARALTEHVDTGLRVSPLLDRLEWLDRWLDPRWRTVPTEELDPGEGWAPPRAEAAAVAGLGRFVPAVAELPAWPRVDPAEISRTGEGVYRDSFTGYRFDDPAMQHALADRRPAEGLDVDGRWWRFDLGRVRLTTVEAEIATTRPAEVSIAYADRLDPHGEVTPVVALSTGPTRMLQHLTVPAGRHRVEPTGALGGRHVEIRVSDPDAVLEDVAVVERDALGPPRGRFDSDDERLNRIWSVGLDTLRCSAEDVLIDSVRERGGWVGDIVAAGIDLLATGWGDQRLAYRTLVHAAATARPDGLVAGCTPGEPIHLGTYAAQWLSGCLATADADPDLPVLDELAEPAAACVAALITAVRPNGTTTLPWGFVDWGHATPDTGPDAPVLLHLLHGLTAWQEWCRRLGREPGPAVAECRGQLTRILADLLGRGPLTLHTAALGHRGGFVAIGDAATAVFDHYRRGFPYDREAVRLRDPGRTDSTVVTPYFSGVAMPVLLEAGRIADAVALWRDGWGWMLDQGATTWWEVFDDRWSRCHFWGGAPTWQLTRYVLGVGVCFVGDDPTVSITPRPGPLTRCRGTVPLGRRGVLDLSWERHGEQLTGIVAADLPWTWATLAGPVAMPEGEHRITMMPGPSGSWRPAVR